MSEETKETEEEIVAAPEEETPAPKKKSSSKKKTGSVRIFEAELQKQRTPKGSAPIALISSSTSPKVGDTIEIETKGGQGYSGTVAEVEEIDGLFVVAFTDEGLQPA